MINIYYRLCGKGLNNDSDYCSHCSRNLEKVDKAVENLKIYIKKIYDEQQSKKKN